MRVAAAAAIAAIACLSAPPARAGVLSKVVHGMKQKSGQSGRNGAASGDDGGDDGARRAQRQWGDGYASCARCGDDPTAPVVARGYHPAYPQAGGRERFELYFGLQSVVDSNYAAAVSALAINGSYGAAFTNTSYFEHVPGADGRDDTLRLDVWDFTLQYRVLGAHPDDRTQLWLLGGFAGATSDGLEIYGGAVGARLTHNLAGELGASGSVRHLRYQDDIRGVEARVGVAVSVLRVSYRYLQFNVGPPLKGPELGLALRF